MAPAPVLLSKALDPLLGVFTGVLAYRLYETNPRTAVPQDQTLIELAKWKLAKWKRQREEMLASKDDEITGITEILNADADKGKQ